MRAEIRELLNAAYDHVVSEYGKKGYEFWKALIGDQINFLYPDEGGKQIDVMPVWDNEPGGQIRVFVSIVAVSFWREPSKCFFVNKDGSIEA